MNNKLTKLAPVGSDSFPFSHLLPFGTTCSKFRENKGISYPDFLHCALEMLGMLVEEAPLGALFGMLISRNCLWGTTLYFRCNCVNAVTTGFFRLVFVDGEGLDQEKVSGGASYETAFVIIYRVEHVGLGSIGIAVLDVTVFTCVTVYWKYWMPGLSCFNEII